MRESVIQMALERVAADIAALIRENSERIIVDIQEQEKVKADEDPLAGFAFSLSFGAKISPKNNGADVDTNVAWNVKQKKTSTGFVSDQPELPLGDSDTNAGVTIESGGDSVTIDSEGAKRFRELVKEKCKRTLKKQAAKTRGEHDENRFAKKHR